VFRTIRQKLIISSLLAVGIPLALVSILLASLLWKFYLRQLERELNAQAFIIASAAMPYLSTPTPDHQRAMARMVDYWRFHANVRVTVADAQGVVRAATVTEDVGTPVKSRLRPGLVEALKGDSNSTIWKNPRLGNQDTMYVNIPVRKHGRIIGAVRVAYTLTQIQENLGRIRLTLLGSVTLYALLIVLLTVWLAGSIVRPVEELNRSALQIAAGDFDHSVHVNGTEEITHLADTLNRTTQRLQQLERLRRQFVSNVSHELRTPLAAIRGMAETLIQHGESDPVLRGKYLPRIVTQTERLARLASQLLDLTQIESGNLVIAPMPISLALVVDDAVRTFAETADAKGVHLVVNIPETLPDLHGDRDRLVQVFLNLLDNALRHTLSGGSITVTARHEGNQLSITVADTGEGVPPEHLPHIFERFYRVDKARSRQSGGTGLGLSIVQQIVQAHGGSISVDSAAEQGTRFNIALPLAAPY
jgi:signal transduction histidine kinase